jgi:cytochrome bd ubiquinol oxidase subunit II
MPNLLAARSQMAMSLGFHILFAMVGIAMPVLMVVAECRWQRTGIYLGAAGAVFVAAFGTLGLSLLGAPLMGRALTRAPWAPALHLAAGAAAVTAIWALWGRRYRLARVAAAGQVSLILWGWALAQYPYLIPPDLTIRAAAAPRITLILILWALTAGGLVLFPSLVYLLRVFKRAPARP